MKQLLTVLVGLLLTNSVVHAQANNTVNHLANPFEKAIEKITLFLKFTNDAKTDYLLFILEKRVAELMAIEDIELRKLGEAGKDRREEEDEAAIQQLRKKHHVS